jgi:hypothetical protein
MSCPQRGGLLWAEGVSRDHLTRAQRVPKKELKVGILNALANNEA